MLIPYKDLEGGDAAFKSDAFVRMRQTYGDFEPEGAVSIRVVSRRIFAGGAPDDLLAGLSPAVKLATLTTPVGLPVWVASDRIEQVRPASAALHHPDAKAVVVLSVKDEVTIEQQVRETVAEVAQATA
ncbi:MAG: hypothetical protein AAF192_07455 [Pseudomonadota bacterium]